ncbi:hypothetical protein N8J89_08175 [Crossiella sp. CA-258035]|uniref:hypothetical protein n=1 Tax=Crossiella sp. CA-258035 TaxID=2981138 RepID=UPI0024BC783B|nr:hypothetical protein [Crossiella sp. CA-258035]WHT21032.1 hypothetical protein N8J89_08175 [Crossiella sp. CA-258035]
MTFDLAQVLSLAIGTLLPVLVGLVTRWDAGARLRAVLLAALSAVSAFLSELLESVNTGTQFDAGATLLAVLGTFTVAVATHYGLWSPTGVADRAQAAPGFIGGTK